MQSIQNTMFRNVQLNRDNVQACLQSLDDYMESDPVSLPYAHTFSHVWIPPQQKRHPVHQSGMSMFGCRYCEFRQ
jgi:hypothetical protein